MHYPEAWPLRSPPLQSDISCLLSAGWMLPCWCGGLQASAEDTQRHLGGHWVPEGLCFSLAYDRSEKQIYTKRG